jgi:hypothetical protein
VPPPRRDAQPDDPAMPTYATDTARAVAPGAPAPGPCRSCAHARTRLRQLGIDSQPGVGSDAVDERIPERHGAGAPIRRLRLGRSACEEDDDGALDAPSEFPPRPREATAMVRTGRRHSRTSSRLMRRSTPATPCRGADRARAPRCRPAHSGRRSASALSPRRARPTSGRWTCASTRFRAQRGPR